MQIIYRRFDKRGSVSWTADGQSCSNLQALISLEEKGWKLSELPLVEMFCLESLSIRHYEDMGRRQNPRSREKKIINVRVAAMGTSLEIQTVVLVKCCVCVCPRLLASMDQGLL